MADLKKAYKQLKEDYPLAYTALAIAPLSGQALAISDYAEAMDDGDFGAAKIAALSIIPGLKLGKYGSKLAPASLRLKSGMNVVEKAINPIVKIAPAIGKAMAVEQVGEYGSSKLVKEAAAAEVEKSREEYLQAWNEQPHESFTTSGNKN